MDIKGHYLYDLSNGKTIGVKDDNADCFHQKPKAITISDGSGQWDDNNRWADFDILGDDYSLYNSIKNGEIKYGTVQDLSFSQIVELFLQGNMTKEDLQIGLECKDATNISITDDGQITTAVFTYLGKQYELNCITEAAKSQIDDVTVNDYSNNISVTTGCRVYEEYTGQDRYNWGSSNGMYFTEGGIYGGTGYDMYYAFNCFANPQAASEIQDKYFQAISDEFGIPLYDFSKLTDEQVAYINAHPSKYHIHIAPYNDPISGTNLIVRSNGEREALVDDIVVKEQIDALKDTGNWISPEEWYYYNIKSFKYEIENLESLKEFKFDYYPAWEAIYSVELDGNNVKFTDKIIDCIMQKIDVLKNSNDYQSKEQRKSLAIFGITKNDTRETVIEKIQSFCKSIDPSSDGFTLHIEDYYAVLNATIGKGMTYDQLVADCNEFLAEVDRRATQQAALYAQIDGGNSEVNSSGGTGAGSSVGGTTVVNPVTSTFVPSDDYTQEELDAIKQEQYNILIDEIKNSTVYSDYATRYKDLPFYYINCFAYLYTQVGLDANNNVLLDDNFKEQLKEFFLACAEYSVKYPSSIYDTYYNSTFGPTLKLLGIEEGSLKSEDFAKLANDSAGLDQVIANMRSVIGVSDSEPITIEKYYAALAKCGVGHETNPQLYTVERATYSSFYTEEAFIEAARLQHFLEDYKNSSSYDPYFVSEFTHPYPNGGNTLLQGSDMISPPGTLRTDEIIDLILNDPTGPYRNDLLGIIEFAAGISVDDKPSVKTEKLKTLFKSLNYTPLSNTNDDLVQGYVNGVDLYRYLLGNNPENIDYFATHNAMLNATGDARQKKEDWLKSHPTVDYDYDSSISIEEYSDSYIDKIKFRQSYFETQADADKAEEIYNFIADLVAPLYNKWYEKLGANNYKYFTEDDSAWYDVDSDYYAKRGLGWKNDSDRENCYKEFAAVAQQIIEKYGDLFSSFTFDGEKFVYTLKNAEGVFTPTVENTGNMYHPFDKGYFEACCDNPISFLPVITYATNPPEALPVDEDGGTIVKTDYKGILVSTTGNIYLWDEIEQKYWKLDGSKMGYPNLYQVASEILSGNCDKLLCHTPNLGLDTSIMNYIDLLAFSLINGYNRTSSPNILEKDGVYYTFDESRLRQFGSNSVKLVVMAPITQSAMAPVVNASESFGEDVPSEDNPVNETPTTNAPEIILNDNSDTKIEKLKTSFNNSKYSSELYPALWVDSCDGENVVLGEKFKKAIFNYLHNIFNLMNNEMINQEDSYINVFNKYRKQDPLLNALFEEDYSGIFFDFQQIADITNGHGGYTNPELRNRIFSTFVSGACDPEKTYETCISGTWTIPVDYYYSILENLGLLPDDFTSGSEENKVHTKIEEEINFDNELSELFDKKIDLVNNPPKQVATIDEIDALAEKLGMQKDEQGFYWKSGHAKETGPLCFTWNPITQRFEKVEKSINGYADPSSYYNTANRFPGIWQMQLMSMAAVRQNLNFTTDPRVCVDEDNNFWVYDSKKDMFVKQDNVKYDPNFVPQNTETTNNNNNPTTTQEKKTTILTNRGSIKNNTKIGTTNITEKNAIQFEKMSDILKATPLTIVEDKKSANNDVPTENDNVPTENDEVLTTVNDVPTAKDKDNLIYDILNKYSKELSAYAGASAQFANIVSALVDSYLNGEISKSEFDKLVESMFNDVLSAAKEDKEVHETTISSEDYTKKRDELAQKLGLIESQKGSCIYYGANADGSYSYYIYSPDSGKFIEFDRAESSEKAEQQKQDAILKAQQMDLDYTANYPWICRKGDTLYRYENGRFVKFYTAYKSKTESDEKSV